VEDGHCRIACLDHGVVIISHDGYKGGDEYRCSGNGVRERRGVDQTCAKSYGELWLNLDHKDSIGK
jgi:hypothetical protein